MRRITLTTTLLGLLLAAACYVSGRSDASQPSPRKTIRIGLVGLDTSHVIAFTKIINAADAGAPLNRAEVVAGYPGGSKTFPPSYTRVDRFTRELRAMGITIVDSIDELVRNVDAVMLESVDGNQHLEQARIIFKYGKPVYIDKPLAANLADAVAIYKLGKKTGTPWFSSSSSRFSPGYPELRDPERVGSVLGCITYSRSVPSPGHGELFYYGVHGVDLLYSLMGRGCREVSAVKTEYFHAIRGVWADGRVAEYRGLLPGKTRAGVGALVFGQKSVRFHNGPYNYRPLLEEVIRFFETGKPPVAPEECVEVMAFLEAAERSMKQNGAPVRVQELIERAGGLD